MRQCGRPRPQQFTIGAQAAGRQISTRLGDPGDTPVPGQYDGDGKADLAVYHDGRFDVKGVGKYEVGAPGDVPMPPELSKNLNFADGTGIHSG
ncbi:hypothetical protein GCM10020218_083460 [Dactylosporangium vinaceum]